MKKTTFGILLTTVVILNSALRFQPSAAPAISVRELLAQSKWTAIHNYEDMDLDGNFTEFGRDCDKDNHWTFRIDSILRTEQGPIICDTLDTSANEILEARWSLDNSDQYLTLDFELDEVRFFIQNIGLQQMILYRADDATPGVHTHKIILHR